MSAANWFIAIGLFAVAAAGGGMAYRQQDPLPISCPAPVVMPPAVSVAAPIVNVAAPAPAQTQASAPAREVAIAKRRVVKKKPVSNVKKLRTKWGAS